MKPKLFVDTCSLLNNDKTLFKDYENYDILITYITLLELEEIKTSKNKSKQVIQQARNVTKLLNNNPYKWECVMFSNEVKELYASESNFPMNNDGKILSCIKYYMEQNPNDISLLTDDISMKAICENFLSEVKVIQTKEKEKQEYKGYIEDYLEGDKLLNFYNNYLPSNMNVYSLKENQYLILHNKENEIIDIYKWKGGHYISIHSDSIQARTKHIESKFLGSIYPKDAQQICAFDSLKSNQFTVLRGKAGSGKSLIGLTYLFSLLESNKIDRIIMFVNPVATKDSCKFGFLPGTALDKILGSQIGNFLMTKLGSLMFVEDLIAKEQLILLPIADIRGVDTSGLRAGVYLTESQNTTVDMMKLIVQRLGEDSICVFEGDDKTQVDYVAYEENNGLKRLSEVFRGESYYGEITLNKCYRSRIAEKADEM